MHLSNKGLVSGIYIKNSTNQYEKYNPIENSAKALTQHLTKAETQLANQLMTRYLMSLEIMGVEVRITVRHHPTPT